MVATPDAVTCEWQHPCDTLSSCKCCMSSSQVLIAAPALCVRACPGICPHKKVVCLVVDECHRAKGNSDVVLAVKKLREEKCKFRVLGLSATPGSSNEAIQVCHLCVSTLPHCAIFFFQQQVLMGFVVLCLLASCSSFSTLALCGHRKHTEQRLYVAGTTSSRPASEQPDAVCVLCKRRKIGSALPSPLLYLTHNRAISQHVTLLGVFVGLQSNCL